MAKSRLSRPTHRTQAALFLDKTLTPVRDQEQEPYYWRTLSIPRLASVFRPRRERRIRTKHGATSQTKRPASLIDQQSTAISSGAFWQAKSPRGAVQPCKHQFTKRQSANTQNSHHNRISRRRASLSHRYACLLRRLLPLGRMKKRAEGKCSTQQERKACRRSLC